MQDGDRRGVFLPSVWERFPDAAQFVDQLKRKADVAPDHWSDSLRVSRFTAESFGAL
ncbi:MAG: AMMECR1 domain-containing protein [Rhodospirillales bacterium]|nr:AMMECR1 domain-containing protein [Rhodospirillales bacterium]